MWPAVGDIVLVKAQAFIGECPGIVTNVDLRYHRRWVNVRVFTDEPARELVYLRDVQPQGESSAGWGWRFRGDAKHDATVPAALSAEEQLARV
jgi:hypothetical protein